MVLEDVLTDARKRLAIVPEGGTGMWGKVPPLEGTDHLGTAVPCEGHGWESEQEPVRLPQPFSKEIHLRTRRIASSWSLFC